MAHGFRYESIAWDSIGLDDARHAIVHLVEALATIDLAWLRMHPEAPQLYSSGVRYCADKGRPIELQWWDVPRILRAGCVDCKGAAGWRLAELRLHGFVARPVVQVTPLGFHVVIEHEDGTLENPSALLKG